MIDAGARSIEPGAYGRPVSRLGAVVGCVAYSVTVSPDAGSGLAPAVAHQAVHLPQSLA